jgi:hypothetical protein
MSQKQRKQHPSGMRGWTELCSDVNWEDYHGMWARKAPDGSFYVLKWTNLYDAMGERDCLSSGALQYECDVKRLALSELSVEDRQDALRYCGLRLGAYESHLAVLNEYDNSPVVSAAEHGMDTLQLCIVEACIQYGYGAPLESFTGNVRPRSIRAEARRYAESLMRDGATLRERLARPVNAIGSTASEYGRGDIDSALYRGPVDTAKGIVRKMHGIPEDAGPLATATVRVMKQSDMRKCMFAIMLPSHYREDGSCKCDDPNERLTMISEWGYSPDDFADVPLREK